MRTYTEPAREIPIIEEVDVVVAGGGPAGIAAATAAARNGARTLLIEGHGYTGGVGATGIPFQGFHDDRNRRIVGGIAWEPIAQLIAEGSSPGPWHFDHVYRGHGAAIMYDPERFKAITSEMVRDAGASLLLHTLAVAPIMDGRRLRGVIVESKAGRQAITAQVVIDATGDGDIAARAGADFEQGSAAGFCQPVTVLFTVANIDIDQFLGYIDAHPADFDLETDDPRYREQYAAGVRVGINGLRDICRAAQARGEFDMPDPLLAIALMPEPGVGILNMAKVKGIDSTDNRDLTRAEVVGMDMAWKTLTFLRQYAPGFGNARMASVLPHVGIRESRRITGDFTLDIPDMIASTVFPDRIAIGGRGVDIHDPTPDGSQSAGSMYRQFPDDYYFPYRCLLPRGLDGILTAGRCISVGYVAFGSTRVMGPCMATGEAAGTAAALAVRAGVAPRELDVGELQAALRAQGAILDLEDAAPAG